MAESILIVSASLDEHTYGSVKTILEKNNYDVIAYLTDEVLNDISQFNLEISKEASLIINYAGRNIHPDRIAAAWYRKLGNYNHNSSEHDLAKKLYLNAEIGSVHDSVWDLYPKNIWLNSPDSIRKSDRKFAQLLLAKELGFTIPQTILTNSWETISTQLLSSNTDQAIVKTIRGVISEQNTPKAMYTTPINHIDIDRLKSNVSPFPGLYQPYIEKFREWRVTVVDEKVFPVSIVTLEDAKDDWRKHQLSSSVEFKIDKFKDEYSVKCINYLGKLGLKYGAFDFIETPDTELVFLECNPNGQYMWLEKLLNLPISEAIADSLIQIAKEH